MRIAKFWLPVCLWWKFAAISAAGIYSPGDASEQPLDIQKPPPPAEFRQRLAQLGSLAAVPVGQPIKAHYLERQRALEARLRQPGASNDDRLALSAIMMRLGENAQAMSILRDDTLLVRADSLAAAQLSVLLALEGKYEDAAIYCRQALEGWPRARAGYTSAQLRNSKRVEQYSLDLYRSRARERAMGEITGREPDNLFAVRLAARGPAYVPGRPMPQEQRRVPTDALGIVEQLLLWMPSDTRLYWQYAELLNAMGDTNQAAQVMDECLWNRRYDAPLLRQHRQILREALARAAEPGITALPEPEPAAVPASWRIDRGLVVVVGALAALITAYLAYQQVRESRRKRLKRGA